MTVLLIDDDPGTGLIVRSVLAGRFDVVQCSTVDEGFKLLRSQPQPDLILLDVHLPDASGLEAFPELKAITQLDEGIPIIFLTGMRALSDRLIAFSLGADDYIMKPFEPLELRARIESKVQAHLKRSETILRRGRWEIDPSTMRAYVHDPATNMKVELVLTPHEFRLFHVFVQREGQVLSREVLMSSVWGPNTHVLQRTIDRHVSALRKKLDPRFERIESVFGVGYRLKVLSQKESNHT